METISKRQVARPRRIGKRWGTRTSLLKKFLMPDQLKILKKNYPFPKERDILICILRQKGVTAAILAKLTGLSLYQIYKIEQKGIEPLRDPFHWL